MVVSCGLRCQFLGQGLVDNVNIMLKLGVVIERHTSDSVCVKEDRNSTLL